MESRRRGFRSVPPRGHEYVTKSELATRRSFPLCPPLVSKVNKRFSQRSLFQEKAIAKAVFSTKPVSLSPLYSPDKSPTYFEQTFVRYGTIGEGSFGVVFKVKSLEDDGIYAVKQFKIAHNSLYGHAEVENHEKIGHHNNCVKLIMAWEERKIVYIQMEYCQLSLAQYANTTEKIAENQLWEIMYDMLQALDYLHGKNLIHLDIKPGNIMITNGTYKLGDFGLLVDLNRHDGRKTSTISDGDAKYLACEVLDGIYTYSCDIFGLGISLLELATNIELPEFGPLWHQIRKQYLPAALYQNVSKNLSITIENMMCNIHWRRPKATVLLKNANLKRVQKQDLITPRPQYGQNYPEEVINNNNRGPMENNNILDTPRRPMHAIRSNLNSGGFSDSRMNVDLSDDSCENMDTSPDRKGWSRTKLSFS